MVTLTQNDPHPHRSIVMLAAWMEAKGWRCLPEGWRRIHPSFEVLIPHAAIRLDARHPERFVHFIRGFELAVAEQAADVAVEWDTRAIACDPSGDGLVRGGFRFCAEADLPAGATILE